MREVQTLSHISTKELVEELSKRAGPVKHLAEAAKIQLKKSEDYNQGQNSVRSYFPFGLISYAQMIHTKSQRLNSLAVSDRQNNPNFESVKDTALDMINYCSFLADYLEEQESVSNGPVENHEKDLKHLYNQFA